AAEAYLGRFAAARGEARRPGKHERSELLAVSFSSLDLVGHVFGPDSQEVQDMLAQLDRTLGTLFARLDALVGPDAYVVALTSDHGVTPIPEQLAKAGKDAGRIDGLAIVDRIEQRAQATLGPGKYVARLLTNDLYFEPGMYDKLKATPGALQAVIDVAKTSPGIERVFRSEGLANGGAADFATRVLFVVRRIPPGRVATYGDVARLAGRPRASRAVGNIMRDCRRPDIPCHRVIAAGGRLGGYGGHEALKRALLGAE